jgi:hypothetical protein
MMKKQCPGMAWLPNDSRWVRIWVLSHGVCFGFEIKHFRDILSAAAMAF